MRSVSHLVLQMCQKTLATAPVIGLDHGFMPSSSFVVSMLYIFLLGFLISLYTNILFVIATTLHLYTFQYSTYLFSCQYIANNPSKFFQPFTLILNAYTILMGKYEGSNHLYDVGVDGMVTLKWLLKTSDEMVWAGFVRLFFFFHQGPRHTLQMHRSLEAYCETLGPPMI